MSDWNQAPPPAEGPAAPPEVPPAPHPALEFLEPAAVAPGPLEPAVPPLPRRVLHLAFALALLGFGALLLGQMEAALLVGMAAFFFVAQGAAAVRADTDDVAAQSIDIHAALFLGMLHRHFRSHSLDVQMDLIIDQPALDDPGDSVRTGENALTLLP